MGSVLKRKGGLGWYCFRSLGFSSMPLIKFFDTFSVQSKLTEWKDTHTIRVDQISQSDQASDACDRGLDFTFC